MNMHLLMNLEWCVCAFTSECQPLPAKEEEGILAVYTYVLCKSCMWVLLKAAPCLWQSVWPAVSASSLCVSGAHAQLHRWLHLQTGKRQPHPSAWAETLCPRAGLQQPSRRSLGRSGWRRWPLQNPLSGLLYLYFKKEGLGFLFLLLCAFPKLLQIYECLESVYICSATDMDESVSFLYRESHLMFFAVPEWQLD